MTAVEEFYANYYPMLGDDAERDRFRQLFDLMVAEIESNAKKP